jgi:predicted phage terminase large subunit-like protein
VFEFLGSLDRTQRLLDKALPPRKAPPKVGPPDFRDHWSPNPGPQAEFFESDCHELLYGGEAGGGKSAALTALALKWSHIPTFSALTIRREYKQTKQLRKYSRQLYRKVYPGLEPVQSDGYTWRFPSGAEAAYGHCEHEDDYQKYDGEEIQLLCLDELTHFTRTQYLALSARVRTSDPRCPTYIRCTTNPGGPGHDWVFGRWGAWLDPEFSAPGLELRTDASGAKLPPAKPGEVWWIRTLEDGSETYHRSEVPGSLSRSFIPAGVSDNPYITEQYTLQLNQLDAVRRAQLRDGNWLIKPAAGLLFKRHWVELIDEPGPIVRKLRAWDLAASEKEKAGDNPDWTVGVLMGVMTTNRRTGEFCYVVLDVIRQRLTPGGVKALIRQTAELDGEATPVFIPQDPGQAGKSQVYDFATLLDGYQMMSTPVTGDKVTRFGPFSSAAEHGRIKVLGRPWTAGYFSELEAFPSKGIKDDQADATSDAFRLIVATTSIFDAL